jgi:HTH-type transcriptional regulator/antitoxin HigA
MRALRGRGRNPAPVTRPLRTEREYAAAIAEIETLLDHGAPAGTPEYDRLDLLSVLVEAYETRHYPEPADPTPQAMVAFALEQRGMSRAVLAPLLGGRSRVSDFFAGKRRLSLSQVTALREELAIPADLLIERIPNRRTA